MLLQTAPFSPLSFSLFPLPLSPPSLFPPLSPSSLFPPSLFLPLSLALSLSSSLSLFPSSQGLDVYNVHSMCFMSFFADIFKMLLFPIFSRRRMSSGKKSYKITASAQLCRKLGRPKTLIDILAADQPRRPSRGLRDGRGDRRGLLDHQELLGGGVGRGGLLQDQEGRRRVRRREHRR